MLALVVWFAAELITGSGQAGLAERAAGIAQALWPLAVVLSCRRTVIAASDRLREPAAWAAGPETTPGTDLLWGHPRLLAHAHGKSPFADPAFMAFSASWGAVASARQTDL